MTDDAKLFHTNDVGLPLFQGDMIHMFTDSFSSPTYWIDEKEGKLQLIKMGYGSRQHSDVPSLRLLDDTTGVRWLVRSSLGKTVDPVVVDPVEHRDDPPSTSASVGWAFTLITSTVFRPVCPILACFRIQRFWWSTALILCP